MNFACVEDIAVVCPPTYTDASEQFEKLALEQMDTLYRVARRLTRDPERANDLVQETYLRAFRAKESFELKEYGIRPWLLRIMQNLHFSRAGREQRQPVAMEDGSLEARRPRRAAGNARRAAADRHREHGRQLVGAGACRSITRSCCSCGRWTI